MRRRRLLPRNHSSARSARKGMSYSFAFARHSSVPASYLYLRQPGDLQPQLGHSLALSCRCGEKHLAGVPHSNRALRSAQILRRSDQDLSCSHAVWAYSSMPCAGRELRGTRVLYLGNRPMRAYLLQATRNDMSTLWFALCFQRSVLWKFELLSFFDASFSGNAMLCATGNLRRPRLL